MAIIKTVIYVNPWNILSLKDERIYLYENETKTKTREWLCEQNNCKIYEEHLAKAVVHKHWF